MASTYNNEPQPTAKVLLLTTGGDIELEIFAKQTPLASKNFLQLCLDGYYDNTIFHRLVPGFILQGGDPTGTGSGGGSIYENGKPFEDEFSNRLKFNRRGLLGMANSGGKNDNGSQFFLTLGPTLELTGRNTMFGRIVGDTIYNLVRMAEGEVAEGSDRPLFPEKITGAEVLVNPFEGMIKRVLTQRAPVVQAPSVVKKKKKTVKVSLNMDGDEDDGLSLGPPIKKLKVNPKFAEPEIKPPTKPVDAPKSAPTPAPIRKASPPPTSNTTPQLNPSPPRRSSEQAALAKSREQQRRQRSRSLSSTSSQDSNPTAKRSKATISNTNAQIDALKAAMKRSGPTVTTQQDKPRSALEAFIPATSTRGRKKGAGGGVGRSGAAPSAAEQKSLDMFNKFRERLAATPANTTTDENDSNPGKEDQPTTEFNGQQHRNQESEEEIDTEATLCDLHFVPNCQSCSKWDEQILNNQNGEKDGDGDVGAGWMAHTLSFAKDRLGKDLEWKRRNEEELVVIDPREKEKEYGIKERGGKGRGGRGGRRY